MHDRGAWEEETRPKPRGVRPLRDRGVSWGLMQRRDQAGPTPVQIHPSQPMGAHGPIDPELGAEEEDHCKGGNDNHDDCIQIAPVPICRAHIPPGRRCTNRLATDICGGPNCNGPMGSQVHGEGQGCRGGAALASKVH